MRRSICFALSALVAVAGAETLTWNGVQGDVWGGAAQNWMDESGRTCAWKNGAEAVFVGSACRVRATKGVKAACVRFRANGVCLEGEAEIPVLIADGGTSNTVAFADAAPCVTMKGGGMIVCAPSARFAALDIEEGFVRIADDSVSAKVNVGEAGNINTLKDISFKELSGEGRIWSGELPATRVIPFKNDFDS